MHLEVNGLGGMECAGITVKKHHIEAVCLGSENVGVESVTYHQSGFDLGPRLFHRIVEVGAKWLVGSRIFAQDDVVEEVFHFRCPQFAILHLMETIAAEMQSIALSSEILHQIVCTCDDTRLVGTKVEEVVAHLQTVFLRGFEMHARTNETTGQRPAESLHDEIGTIDLASSILAPKIDIGLPIGNSEVLKTLEISAQIEILVQLSQGKLGIAVRIVERVVEVDEKILVFLHSGAKIQTICNFSKLFVILL